MKTLRRQSANAGFTLLEVILAVTLLGLFVTAVSVTWNAGLSGWKRTAGMTDIFQRERVVMNALSELTQSIVFYRVNGGLYDIVGENDTTLGDSVSFVTTSEALLPPSAGIVGGLRRVKLTMAQDQHSRFYLGIRNRSALSTEDDGRELPAVLSADVSALKIRYWHPQQNAWQDKWEEKSLTPSVIEFTVTFGEGTSRSPAVTITRQVELPSAQYTVQTAGAAPGEAVSRSSRSSSRSPTGGGGPNPGPGGTAR